MKRDEKDTKDERDERDERELAGVWFSRYAVEIVFVLIVAAAAGLFFRFLVFLISSSMQ